MEREIRVNPHYGLSSSLKDFNDTISIARSEIIRLFGKPKTIQNRLYLNLMLVLNETDDTLKLIPFELRISQLGNTGIYDFSKCVILTTNKDWSTQIKAEMNKLIDQTRKDVRKEIFGY